MIEMAFCMKCGKDLPEGAKYCPHCGVPVDVSQWEEFQVSADNLIGRVKELIKEGNIRRIVIRNDKGEVLLEIPVTVGLIGIVFAPYLAALGAIAALATQCTIVVERKE